VRVLHVIPSYLPARRYGGTIFATHALCVALAKAGCEVTVFTTSVDGAGDSDVPLGQPVSVDGVSVWYFHSPLLRRLYYAPAMARALEERVMGFDLVHLHSVFLWPTWAAARVARRSGVPYLISPRGMLVEALIRKRSAWAKRAWIALIERRNLENASAIHVASGLEARELARFGVALPCVIEIPNGAGAETGVGAVTVLPSAVRDLLDSRRPIILYVGRVNWKKGLDRVVSALARVPDAVLLVVGNDEEGATPGLEALACRKGVRDRVVFAGPVYGTTKTELYRRSAVFVLPSYSENFGNVVLEAMHERCPVIVTPEVGAAEIVHSSGGGLVAPGDPESLALAIGKLLNDAALRSAMGRRGQDIVLRRYAWRQIAQRMLEAYAACVQHVGHAKS